MLLGSPCSLTISLKNKSATWLASLTFLQGIKCAIFENLSTTTKTESLPFFVLGSPKTKSIDKSTQGYSGVGKGVYKPCGITFDLAFLQTMQCSQNLYTSCFVLGQ